MNRTNEPKFCECGCGQIVKCRFVSGHNAKFRIISKETKLKLSMNMMGKNNPMFGKHHSDEQREKIRLSMLGKNTGERTKEVKEKLRIANLGKKLSEKTKQKIRLSSIGRPHIVSDEYKAKISKSLKGRKRETPIWNKGLTKETNASVASIAKKKTGVSQTKETKKKHSDRMFELWQNNNFIKIQKESRQIKPNKPETAILNLLNRLYPTEWKYTGDFSFMINGKNPDFVNCNGQKKIIELFGDYWHKGQNPEDRAKIFKLFGYDTLVIWESELKNINKVTNKIIEFHESFQEAKGLGSIND